MTKDPRKMLNELNSGFQGIAASNPEEFDGFMKFTGAACKDGKLDIKAKELISIALSVFSRCEYCIVFHAYNALKAGASKEEIMESAMVAATFGAGPTLAYTATLLKNSLDEFEKDFK